MRITFDRELVEATVLEAAHRGIVGDRFHADREQIYEEADRDERARGFDRFYRSCFDLLPGPSDLVSWISSKPDLASGIAAAIVHKAAESRNQGAELLVARDDGTPIEERRHLVLMLAPEVLLDRSGLKDLLARELLFISDMIDEGFGYAPVIPRSPGGTTHDRLILSRYGALWSMTVAGRLVRAGLAKESVREGARSAFARAFPALGDRTDEAFQMIFGERPTHARLVDFSLAPRRMLGEDQDPSRERCPLCGLPSQDRASPIAESTAALILEDFPDWSSALRPCIQCADLYRSREGLRGDEEEGEED